MNQKHKTLIRMLTGGNKVLILLDPRVAGVMVPEDCYHTLPLGLMLGSNLIIPIPDLSLNADGFSATLSFDRVGHHVTIPWKSIFGMVNEDNEGPLWTEDIPSEVSGNFPLDMEPKDGYPEGETIQGEQDTPSFGIIDGGRDNDTNPNNEQRPDLKLVETNGEGDEDTRSDGPS